MCRRTLSASARDPRHERPNAAKETTLNVNLSYEKLRFAGYRLLDTLSLLIPPARRSPARVLIVRQDAIGDFVMWLDAAREIAQHYRAQGKQVTLLANKAWANWARELDLFDAVVPFDIKAFQYDMRYRMRLARTIRRMGFSLAVQPAYSRDYSADVLIRLSGAPDRVASTGDDSNLRPWEQRVARRSYTRLIPAAPGPLMELLRNAEFVRGLLGTDYKAAVADLHALGPVDPGEAFHAALPKGQPYFALFPGASWDGKQWPLDRFRALAERLHATTGWTGVVCGGPDDRALAATLCAGTPWLLDWAARTSLPQLAGVLSGAHLLVSNDTSAVHVAAAVGTPVVCLLGGGHFGRFLPYLVEQPNNQPLPAVVDFPMPCFGCNWRCIYDLTQIRTAPCVGNLTVEAAWTAIQRLPNLLPIQ